MHFLSRPFLAGVLSFSLILNGGPITWAAAATSSLQWDDVKDTLDVVKPVRKNETFAELYYRLETRLNGDQKKEFGALNKKLKYQMPMYRISNDIKAGENFVSIKDNGQELLVKVEADKEGNAFITVNGRKLTEEEALSPLKTFSLLQSLSQRPANRTSWLWNLLIEPAHALSWGWILAGTAAVAAIGYFIYKKTKSSSNSCTNSSNICCNINGTLTQLTSGCCSDAGGSDTGFTTCPGAMYLEGETTASAVSESSASSSTATSTSSGTQ